MIGLSTPTFDLEGAILLKGVNLSSDVDAGERRIAKYKNLDGTVSIYDNGFVAADTRYSLRIKDPDVDTVDTIRHLISNYAAVIITSLIGCFRAVISQYRYASGELSITIELIEAA